jgi:hypothetical protein
MAAFRGGGERVTAAGGHGRRGPGPAQRGTLAAGFSRSQV